MRGKDAPHIFRKGKCNVVEGSVCVAINAFSFVRWLLPTQAARSLYILSMGHGIFGDVTADGDTNKDVTTRRLHDWLPVALPNALGYPGTSQYTYPFHATLLYGGEGSIDQHTAMQLKHAIRLDTRVFHATVKRLKAVGDEETGLIIMCLDCPSMVACMKTAYDVYERMSGKKPDHTLHGGYVMGMSPHITVAFYASLQAASDDLRRFRARSPSYGGGTVRLNNFRVE